MKTIAASKLPHHLKTARDIYGNDRVKLEDDARIRQEDKGVWVQAWVWVPDKEVVVEFQITGM